MPCPTLAELLNDPDGLDGVPREAIPQLRGELATLDTLLLGRLLAPAVLPGDDQLLSVTEAAARLGVSEDYLYHNHSRLPFTRRIGRKLLFSSLGLAKHVRSK
jgi:hypothetical protein